MIFSIVKKSNSVQSRTLAVPKPIRALFLRHRYFLIDTCRGDLPECQQQASDLVVMSQETGQHYQTLMLALVSNGSFVGKRKNSSFLVLTVYRLFSEKFVISFDNIILIFLLTPDWLYNCYLPGIFLFVRSTNFPNYNHFHQHLSCFS